MAQNKMPGGNDLMFSPTADGGVAARLKTANGDGQGYCLTPEQFNQFLRADGQFDHVLDMGVQQTLDNLVFSGEICMEWDDYLRQQAATYRQLPEKAEDAVVKKWPAPGLDDTRLS